MIAEDGLLEEEDLPEAVIPSTNVHEPTAGTAKAPFGSGFKFGGRRDVDTSSNSSAVKPRRGHHHKHSVSHNFFSFLEPGSTARQDRGQTVPSTPMSLHSQMSDSTSPVVSEATARTSISLPRRPRIEHLGVVCTVALLEFCVGANLWVVGQQCGSLSCTGLGYWVVFDALGILLGSAADGGCMRWLCGREDVIRRPYGCVFILGGMH